MSGLPEPCTSRHCLWCMLEAGEYYLCKRPGQSSMIHHHLVDQFFMKNISNLPSPSGRSMLYSGMHSRNSSSISTAFFSVNLTQQNVLDWLPSSHWKDFFNLKTRNLANSCRGLLPLLLAASADTLGIWYVFQKEGLFLAQERICNLHANLNWVKPAFSQKHSGSFYVAFFHLELALVEKKTIRNLFISVKYMMCNIMWSFNFHTHLLNELYMVYRDMQRIVSQFIHSTEVNPVFNTIQQEF